ncbi:hypothetical protein I6J22_06185 [Corynebacterium kroppenstedtii]|nr:hypothetical protein [Corynebacterium kroppenstedtii]QRP09845.1 hypothetical protein I6J22_06185 [Corynebacterium kroppenstedtii]
MSNQSNHPPAQRITRAMLLVLVIAVGVMVIEWLLLSALNVGNRVTVFVIVAAITSVTIGSVVGQWTRKRWHKEKA